MSNYPDNVTASQIDAFWGKTPAPSQDEIAMMLVQAKLDALLNQIETALSSSPLTAGYVENDNARRCLQSFRDNVKDAEHDWFNDAMRAVRPAAE